MQEEAAKELFDRQGHEPLLVAVSRVSPTESDVAMGETHQPAVGDGDAMSVSAEIAQHVFWTTEGPLGVDDPVVLEQYPQPRSEGARLRKTQEVAVELEGTRMERVPESGDKLAAEDTAAHFGGK